MRVTGVQGVEIVIGCIEVHKRWEEVAGYYMRQGSSVFVFLEDHLAVERAFGC
jgi:hypothetical protein